LVKKYLIVFANWEPTASHSSSRPCVSLPGGLKARLATEVQFLLLGVGENWVWF
jgi:hypothetical protein